MVIEHINFQYLPYIDIIYQFKDFFKGNNKGFSLFTTGITSSQFYNPKYQRNIKHINKRHKLCSVFANIFACYVIYFFHMKNNRVNQRKTMNSNIFNIYTDTADHQNLDNNVQYRYHVELTPRKSCITAKEFASFTKSIKEYGIFEPIIIDETGNVIDGNKRYYAAVSLGMIYLPCITEGVHYIPAYKSVLDTITDPSLHFFQKASSIFELSDKYLMTQEKIAILLGVSQSYVANKMRLLTFTEQQIKLIIEGALTERHARALLRIKNTDKRTEAIRYAVENGMNVSSTEKYIDNIIENSFDFDIINKPQGVKAACKEIDKFSSAAKEMGVFVKINRAEDTRSINYTVKIYK